MIVDIEQPLSIDNVILWEDEQVFATGYWRGQVIMNRVLEATTLDGCVDEVRGAWHILSCRVTRIQEWIQVP